MFSFLSILFLFLLVGCAYAIIWPEKINKRVKKTFSRGEITLICVGIVFVFLLLLGSFAPKQENSPQQSQNENIEENIQYTPQPAPSQQLNSQEEQENADTVETIDNQPNTTPQPTTQVTQKTPTPTPQIKQSEEVTLYMVSDVVDGDTIKVVISGEEKTLRLIGIDTPETVDPRKPVECFGKEASDKAKELLSGEKVRLEIDPTQDNVDRYGRLLRYVHREDGLFFNKWMIENGYAHEYTYETPYQYQAEFKQAETEARENEIGLWNPSACSSSSPSPNTQTTQGHIFYLSTHWSATYYYCDTDSGWESLSEKYLKSYPSEQELLNEYPERKLHEPCKN